MLVLYQAHHHSRRPLDVPAVLGNIERIQLVAAFVVLVAMLLWESAHPFIDLFRERRALRRRHAVRNLIVGLLNSAVVAVGFVGLWLTAAAWAEANRFGLLNALALPDWAHAIGAVVLLDGWTYLWHRLNHVVPFFWRFHKVHHSDASMDVTTGSRFHVGEIVLSSALRVPVILLTGVHVWELLLYETMMFAVVQFHHANIGLPAWLDRTLRVLIVTPAMHKVHHSRIRIETDSNYSAFLSVWDRIGRTFRLRERPEEIEFGLDEVSKGDRETLGDVFGQPFHREERKQPA